MKWIPFPRDVIPLAAGVHPPPSPHPPKSSWVRTILTLLLLLNSLNGAERASLLLEKCLELIEMAGVEVHFVTFDGASAKYV